MQSPRIWSGMRMRTSGWGAFEAATETLSEKAAIRAFRGAFTPVRLSEKEAEMKEGFAGYGILPVGLIILTTKY